MIYFLSDVHLGLSLPERSSLDRERLVVEWLDGIEDRCSELFIVGDFFDFWFEYQRVVPSGFVRVLGRLARLRDRGIPIHFFAGNHDMWLRGYLSSEIGCTVYTSPSVFERYGRRILVAHGDGLSSRDTAGRVLSAVFHSRVIRWLFRWMVHPDLALRFGHWWSRGNRTRRPGISHEFRGVDEPLVRWAIGRREADSSLDSFVFGHLHTPQYVEIGGGGVVLILGEWIENPTVASLDERGFRLEKVEISQ
ncbi:MAG: UDP-2,3-diacylglucosamine diphosphatase [Rikenellaceae bacterium]